MKNKLSFFAIVSLLMFLIACATVPITGRKQINLLPASTINSMAFQQYSEFLAGSHLSDDSVQVKMLKRVGHRIKDAVNSYMIRNNQPDALIGYKWEFNLIVDSLVNAWCMPGGKVAFYTGILPITQNETGLAVVMGHEIAHAIANHGNERMSQGLLASMGSIALSEALKNKPEETQQLFMAAYGVGAQIGVLLPYSRLHESEADHMGLIFMAMAGYNPGEAVNFWQRMANLKQGAAPPEFLSTHPSDDRRIKNIKELLPEAMKHYHK